MGDDLDAYFFPLVLVLYETQTGTSRFWTQITGAISWDDNHYTMNVFIYIHAQSAGTLEDTYCILQMGNTHTQRLSLYDTKQSDVEVPVMQEFWWMQSTPTLPSLPGTH